MAHAILIITVVLAGTTAWASTQGGTITATTPKRGGNPVAAKVTNPVPATAVSIAAGRKSYMLLCSRCHGPAGKGDGGGAGAGGQPADFTDDVWEFGSSDGEIFASIAEGTSADMESYADRVPATDIWNLVNYLRSLKP